MTGSDAKANADAPESEADRSQVLLDELCLPECPRWRDGLGWLPDGRLLAVSMDERRLLRMEHGRFVLHADLSGFSPFECNDMLVLADGRCYVGNFGYDVHGGKAAPTVLVRVEPGGRAAVAADELWFPNGMALGRDGRSLLVAETRACRVTAFDMAPDGALSNRRLWARMDMSSMPDGIALDTAGGLWVPTPRAPRVFRVEEGGEVLEGGARTERVTRQIHTTGRALACAFGGPDGMDLFICTAEDFLPEDARRRRCGRIERVRVQVAGCALD